MDKDMIKGELEATQQTVRFFEMLLRSSADGIVITDASQNIIVVNEAFCSYFGCRWRDVVETSVFVWLEQLDADAPSLWAELESRVHSEGICRGAEFRMTAGDSPRYFSVNASLLEGVADEERGVVISIWRDVTADRRAERMIEHLNAVLLAIRNVNQLIVREGDGDRLVQGICDSLIQTRGYDSAWAVVWDEQGRPVWSAEAGLGEAFGALLERLRRGAFPNCARSALEQSGTVLVTEPSVECPDCPLGGEHKGRKRISIQLEHGGNAYGFLNVSISADFNTGEVEQSLFQELAGDIAFALHGIELEEARQRSEALLKEREESYRTLAENIPGMVYRVFLREDNRMQFFNDMVISMTGYRAEEITEGNLCSLDPLMPAEDGAHVLNTVNQAVLSDQPFQVAYRIRHKDGDIRHFLERGKPIRGTDGEVLYIDGIILDVTERKRMEEAFREAERNRVLMETAGAAAHEINQPLAVVSGLAQLLAKTASPDDARRENLEAIYQGCKRIKGILEKMEKSRQYATTSYVGRAEIVDFGAASGEGNGKSWAESDMPGGVENAGWREARNTGSG